MKKKLLSVMLVGALAISALTGCGSKETASDDSQKTGTTTEADSSSDAADTSDFDNSEMINVQSREDGSGTRGAFTSCLVSKRKMQMEIKLITQLRKQISQTVQK